MNLPIGMGRLTGEWIGVNRDGLICEDRDGMARFRRPGTDIDRYIAFQDSRALGLLGDCIVEVVAPATWPGLGTAIRLLRLGLPAEPWRLALFEQCGELFVESKPVADRADDIVCACKSVTRATIASLAGRCHDQREVGQACGAGTVCGGCGPEIDEIIGHSTMMDAELIAIEPLGPDIKRFRFRYIPDVPLLDQPGAFVHVQGMIDNRRIVRPYTVTATSHDGTLDIIAKRDPAGVFSRWLHDHATTSDAFRLSPPRLTPHPAASKTLVFIAAGIGITPALAEMSASGSETMRVHWSLRTPDASPLVAFVAAEAEAAGCSLTVHDTAQAGRVADWLAVCPPGSADAVMVCGPLSFQHAVVTALEAGGWPSERITVESFVPRGRGPKTLVHVDSFDYLQEPVVAQSFHLTPIASVEAEALAFLRQFYFEHGATDAFELRWRDVAASIAATGTYTQTYEELAFGARLAWRNAARCIGRFFWRALRVRDLRHLATEEAIFSAIVAHLDEATNGGDIEPVISVFAPGEPRIRILNAQLILYAGYRRSDGTILGDPKNLEITQVALDLGWNPPGTAFDMLPVIIQIGTRTPRWFELPKASVLEVPLSHPRHPGFAALGLRWFAVPAVAGMALDVGGIQYSAAPSNGFYMGTEIGSLNLADPLRYNQMPAVAGATGLDTGDPLWRDQAMLDINAAVLHSFKKAGVRILDHHSLSTFFTRFREEEALAARPSYGHWAWIMPPMGGNLSSVWRDHTLQKKILKPNYFYQPMQIASDAPECAAGVPRPPGHSPHG